MAEGSGSGSVSACNESNGSENMEIMTMVDVLKEEEDLEDCTKALLGASDDKNCTYSKGYMKRQALYACITCTPQWKENKCGGVCLACSYHCHEGHELLELYTKRNFQCDCGNSKFPDRKCNLEPRKEEVNELNKYNQNFLGMYCICKRPYPDPDDDSGDSMIQCIICEDWYHERHLGVPAPSQLDWGEMICEQCMKQNEFLSAYVESCATGTPDEGCVLITEKCRDRSGLTHGAFFPEGWRKSLCRCERCLIMYESKGLKFLLDEQDTVQSYEEKGKASGDSETQYERGMKALSAMDRVQRVEAIEGYNDMKSQLMEYLQKFVESKKIVREEDIREFFSGMEARKKQRVEIQHVPHSCR